MLAFFPMVLRLAGGEHQGQAFHPEAWQAFCIASIFGWKWATGERAGQRRFRWVYIETGKGSGKSPMAAGIGLYMLMADGEASAEVYAAATKKDQAMVLFRDAVSMYKQSPELRKRLTTSGGNPIWQLTYLRQASFFKPISNDDGQSGPRPYCSLVDEIHEHKDDKTIEMLEAGIKGRRNPLIFMITNSGSDRTSVCWKYHDLCAKICAGETEDDELFGYVCALDEGDDPFEDESCWIKANPSLGVTIREDYLRSRINKVRNLPDKRNETLRLNFCVWTDADSAWLTREVWMAVQRKIKLEKFAQRKAWIGLDLSRRRDLTAAFVTIEDGQDEDGHDKFAGFAQFWTPGDGVKEREATDNQPYWRWIEDGWIEATPGKFVRFEFVGEWLALMSQTYDLQSVAYDAYAVRELEDVLDDLGLELPLVEHPQGFRRAAGSELWMPGSIEKTEEVIVEHRIRIRPNPTLTWNVASCMFERDAQGNRKLSKRKATGRIDGAVAMVQSCGAATTNTKAPEKSFWMA